MITIEPVENGWIVRDDTEGGGRTVIVEQDESEDHDAFAVRRLLYVILDLLGETGSKHDAERVRVIVVGPDGAEIDESKR